VLLLFLLSLIVSISSFLPSEGNTATMASSLQLEPYQSSYLSLLLSSNILKFGGPFTLKSGRQSPYFFNAGLFCTGESIASIAACYAERIIESGIEFDVLFGPAYKVRMKRERGKRGREYIIPPITDI
jgi:hypothetical protein